MWHALGSVKESFICMRRYLYDEFDCVLSSKSAFFTLHVSRF